DPAFASNKILPIHRWIPWIAGFSKEFVAGAIDQHLQLEKGTILDPFAGVGTTLVEGMLRGHNVIGFEINPYPYLATKTKLNIANVDLDEFIGQIAHFRAFYESSVRAHRAPQSSAPHGFQSRVPFFSPRVLEKVLYVQDFIGKLEDPLMIDLFRLAFTSTMVTYSNYSYEPSLATRASSGKQNIDDALVGETVLQKLQVMADDIQWFFRTFVQQLDSDCRVIHNSFFESSQHLSSETVDLIITSPPYLNNYHYNRNTRPHLYWLGYANKPSDLKSLEESNFGTYWQTARDQDVIELQFHLPNSDLESNLELLRDTHPEKGIYGGSGWANYAATYFNDCLRFAQQAQYALKSGGVALIVVGNSILQGIMFPTDRYLAEIAELAGFEILGIDIPRSTRVGSSIIQSTVRAAKANSKHQLYEAVVKLRKR
ncbi:MAG: site-specific DNA-methyltransferase, partial [Anaerolineae bacterium]|nr:site-specific DNA-methyltransferase [Anaerolineae bacterium]